MPPMAGVEQCIIAIVSAFRSGADMLEATWEQRFGSRRLAETEYELPVREKTLQNALFDAANICQSEMNERQRQLQKRFAIGDSIAMSELSAIMVHLQVQVINALQSARGSGSEMLDFTSLQSTVMIMRSNTLQSMERLSQRLLSGISSDGTAKQLLQRRQSDPFCCKGLNHSVSSMHDPAVERRHRYRASLGPLTAVSRYDSPTTGAAYMQFRAEDRVHLDRLASLWSNSSASSCRSISDTSSSCGSSISSHVGEVEVPETAQATRCIVLAPRVETKADEGAIRQSPPSALPRHDPIPEVIHHPAKKDAVPDSPAPLLETTERKEALSMKARKHKGYQAVSKALSRVANRYRKLRS